MCLHQSLDCLRQEKSVFGALNRTITVDPTFIIPKDSDNTHGLMNLTVKYQRHSKKVPRLLFEMYTRTLKHNSWSLSVPCVPIGAEQTVVSRAAFL